MRGANSFAIHATAESAAGWASHVWECLRTAVRASHSLHGRRLPISATRMRISTRGLVFRQCHNFSSISFNRLSLSVLYITASAVQLRTYLHLKRHFRYANVKQLTQSKPRAIVSLHARTETNGSKAERDSFVTQM